MSRQITISLIICLLAFTLGSALARYQGPTYWLKSDMERING